MPSDLRAFKALGPYPVDESQRERWTRGELHVEWADKYSELFDDDDVRLAENKYRQRRHFWEWYGAILVHQMTGYSCLLAKYEFGNHPRKVAIVSRLLPPAVLEICRDRSEHGNAQSPDLLMYRPDCKDWFFCEVKGPGDSLREPQKQKFTALAEYSGQPVWLLTLESRELLER